MILGRVFATKCLRGTQQATWTTHTRVDTIDC
jgi:hypothetical protein